MTSPLHLRFDAFDLDEKNARLTRDGVAVALAPKAFAVLCMLARHPGQLVTKEALLDAAWGHQFVSDSVLKTTISQLRTALGDDAKQPRFIETASRRGYRFIPAANTSPAAAAAQAPAFIESPIVQRATPGMIGRLAELQRLHGAWRQAQAGRRQIIWVAGEAGVGKSTLIDSFMQQLGEGMTVAFGQCVEHFGAGEPYLPVLEALGRLCRTDASLVPMLRAIAPTWLLQMPWLSGESERAVLQRELAGASQDRMLREMGELLDQYTSRRPLLLVTEDLHWSDHATVRLIDHMARRRGATPLMWLGSFRPADVIADDHPLKRLRQELRLHHLCEEVALEAFSERDVAAYVGNRFPDAQAPESFVRSLHAHTDGLPLFVVNVVDDLLGQGLIDPTRPETLRQLGHDVTWSVPENVAGIIEKQIARLPVELRALLGAASVSGMEFRPQTVADALQRDAMEVHEQCDRLARRHVWLRAVGVQRLADGTLDARYVFGHALYRHVFYRRMGEAARVELHHRVALSLERERDAGAPVASAELALHYEHGQDMLCALRHYADAAVSAIGHFAPMEAARLTAHALTLLPRATDDDARAELELMLCAQRGLACSQMLGLASPEAVAAFERAQALCDALPQTPARAWVMGGLGWIHYVRGEYVEARALAQRIRALATAYDDDVLAVCALNLQGATMGMQGELAAARECMEDGIVRCEALGDGLPSRLFVVDPGVSLRANLAASLLCLGEAEEAAAQMAAARERAQARGEPTAQMLALWCSAMVEMHRMRPQATLAYAQELRRVVAMHGLAQGEGPARWYEGWAITQMGRPEEGLKLVLEGYEWHARLGMYAGCPPVLGYAAQACMLMDELDDARRHCDAALALAHRIGELQCIPGLRALRAKLLLRMGETAAARAELVLAVHEAEACGALWYELLARSHLCELPDANEADAAALQAFKARLPAGFDLDMAGAARFKTEARP